MREKQVKDDERTGWAAVEKFGLVPVVRVSEGDFVMWSGDAWRFVNLLRDAVRRCRRERLSLGFTLESECCALSLHGVERDF